MATAALAAAIASWVARTEPRGFAWLDGGDGHGWLAAEPEQEVRAESLRSLAEVDAGWRACPEQIWIGWLTYDLGVDELLQRPPTTRRLPGLCMRRYAGALEFTASRVVEHGHVAACAALRAAVAARADDVLALSTTWPLEPLQPIVSPEDYRARVIACRRHIAAGDTYQVNLSQRFTASWLPAAKRRPPAERVAWLYDRLRTRTPASMGALIDATTGWIASNSPETLLKVTLGEGAAGGDLAQSWPIKGTRARTTDASTDAAAKVALATSDKDSAEHVMIVDLVRNDLGRVARVGTVQADRKPRLISLPTVHHLVSEVRCTLRAGWSLPDLVGAMFPGGSVTGAPKRRTVEIIEALEREPRGIYCGAIVLLTPRGIQCSLPIRTAWVDEQGIELRSGGGIVMDSDPELERQETLAKASAFGVHSPALAGAGGTDGLG